MGKVIIRFPISHQDKEYPDILWIFKTIHLLPPNNMLTQVLLFLCFALYSQAQIPPYGYPAEPIYPPQPYDYGYQALTWDGGSLSKQESGDEGNRKTGSYSLSTPEGTVRQVRYVADELGFRATIETNEPGTVSSAPAGVQIISTADPLPAIPAPSTVPQVAPYARPYPYAY